MQLTILTPHKKLVDREEIDQFIVPGVEGQIEIFPQYADFVTSINPGVLRWKNGGTWKAASISHGWLQISDQVATVLADVSEMGSEIDLARARKAEETARMKIQEGGLDDTGQQKYALKLARALARAEAAQLK